MLKTKLLPFLLMILLFQIILLSEQIHAEKYVTIFYSCWANETLNTTYGDDVYIMGETPYSPYPQWNWWGKPLYAAEHGDGTIKNNYRLYFDSPENPNNDLIDWHAELLTSAGIDFITLDLTNGTQTKIVNGAKAICKRYAERFANQLPTPQIVFWVQDSVCLQTVESEIFNVYNNEIFFEYLGKKLVNVAGGNVAPAIPTAGIFGKYTCRRMWGLDNTGQFWQFKVNSDTPPPPFYFNGEPEQMCVPVATQATYMTQDGISASPGARGRQNGNYFTKYFDAAIEADVKFIFIHSWNEWTAQNFGNQETPVFVDLWKSEYSSDIEPVSGSHGWFYYNLMREKIAEFKNVNSIETENQEMYPAGIRLNQNYPNPFNGTTNFEYYLTAPSRIDVEVFNSLGEKIYSEYVGERLEGWYKYVLTLNDLPSGVYFFRLTVNSASDKNYVLKRKFVLLK